MKNADSRIVSVVVIDDVEIFRRGIIASLADDRRIEVVAQGDSPPEAESLLRQFKPHVLVFGLGLGTKQSDQAIRSLKACSPQTRVVLFGNSPEFPPIREQTRHSADAFLANRIQSALLSRTLVCVADSRPGEITAITSRPDGMFQDASLFAQLSAREREVLRIVAEAKTNAQVGALLYISEGTVKRHLSNIFKKLDGATSRMDAVQRAAHAGILDR